ISNCRRERIDVRRSANTRGLQEEPIEHVLELRTDVEHNFTFTSDAEVAAETEGLRRLPLPAVVVVVRRGRSELAARRIRPCGRIQHGVLRRIDAVAVRILQEEILLLHAVEERVAAAPGRRIVFRAATQLRQQTVGGTGYADQIAALVAEHSAE